MVDASRIYVQEGAYTARRDRLDFVLLELFSAVTGQDVFPTITRTAGLITKIEYFTDATRTKLDHECDLTYIVGGDGVSRVSTMVTIYLNFDLTEDSRVTVTITRDGDDLITQCNSVFSTSEDTKL